jgi:hypothetical protein
MVGDSFRIGYDRERQRQLELWAGLRDDQHLGAPPAELRVALLHLAEVRPARDSGQVAQEDEEQRPAGERGERDDAAVGLHEGQARNSIAES